MFAAVNDVARQSSQAKGELVPEVKKNTNQNEECSKEDKRAAEFAERFHRRILLEAVNQPSENDPLLVYTYSLHIFLCSVLSIYK